MQQKMISVTVGGSRNRQSLRLVVKGGVRMAVRADYSTALRSVRCIDQNRTRRRMLPTSNDAASYPEDSFENMKRFAKAHDFPLPYLHDGTQAVARAYGAVCTPDFFGYSADRKLKYRGRSARRRTYNSAPRGGTPRACRGHASDCDYRCCAS